MDPCNPDVNTGLSFFHGMYINSCLYSSLGASHSTLSSTLIVKGYAKLSEHPFISHYLKCLYNRHPPLPKYNSIWDMSLVLDHLYHISLVLQ